MIPDFISLQADLRSNPRRWLVTGAAGFIGSHLVQNLAELGQQVVALDNLATGYLGNLRPFLSENIRFIEGSVCDSNVCEEAVKGCDHVLHQAALGSVPRSIKQPLNFHEANVSGFLALLEASRKEGIKRFVFASSSSVYGDEPELPKVEGKEGQVLSPYAATKLIDEIYAAAYQKTYGIEWVGLRYFNVFGARQDPNGAYAAVLPKWVDAMIEGTEVFINGDGETSRDFCYIDNVVQANLLAATSSHPEAPNRPYNVAAGERTTLNELFGLLRDAVKGHLPSREIADPCYRDFRAGDVRHSLADISAARDFLGYIPSHLISDGIPLAVSAYVANHQSGDV